MSNIESLLSRINNSETEWKALYMATWHYSECIKTEYSKKGMNGSYSVLNNVSGTSYVVTVTHDYVIDETVVRLGLPASKRGHHEFNVAELHSILTSYDGRLTLNHLIIIFSLFESFLNEVAWEIFQKKLDTGKFKGMKDFFKINDFKDLKKSNPNLINELNLAKETRNCFTHNNSKIDLDWINLYKSFRGRTPCSDGDSINAALPNIFHEVEDWHNLIVDTANQIYQIISAKGFTIS